jgi:glycosyltransferase involved in cell wall biosynthesis
MISILTICLNEEELINQCLDYATSGIADEVVIVDGGSTDKTVRYIRDHIKTSSVPIRLTINPMPPSFADQRNFAKALCKGDWILHLDVDEKYTPNLALEIDDLTKIEVQRLGYSFPTYHLIQDEQHFSNTDVDPHIRLFRNIPELKYYREVHEYLKYNDIILHPHPQGMDNFTSSIIYYTDKFRLLHYTQLRSPEDKEKKWRRYEQFVNGSAEAGIPISKDTFVGVYGGPVFDIPKEMLE